ncbi:MAG TPA: monovalent cation/H+ antiporter complex subunit F [Methanoregula sp.]|nr:monovalent cation/H+ antiporter complex subunit F [Methanoregula sp.]
MIDTWLFAALCLFILAACAFLRAIPGPSPFDRIIAANAGVTIALSGILLLGIAWGSLVLIEAAVVAGLLCYGGIFAMAHTVRGEPS